MILLIAAALALQAGATSNWVNILSLKDGTKIDIKVDTIAFSRNGSRELIATFWHKVIMRPEDGRTMMVKGRLNCDAELIQVVGGIVYSKEGKPADIGSDEWKLVAPESNADTLRQVICKLPHPEPRK